MTVQKIGIIAQEGTNPAFVQGTYHVVNNLLNSCGNTGKYQVFQAPNATPFVNRIVHYGMKRAALEERLTERGFRQINAEPIIDGMLECSKKYPDTEFVMVMRDSIYVGEMNYFLGVSSSRSTRSGRLLNSTIVSCGKGSPFEMDSLTFQALLMHELGHRFGATDQQNRKPGELYNYEQLGTHCTTPGCVMNVVNSLYDAKLAAHRRATYCPGCLRAIRQGLSR